MTILISIKLIAWVSIVIITIYEWARNIFFAPSVFQEGDNCIIIENTENTKFPEKYSEGVFAFYQNGKFLTSEAYQIEKGGDPMVYKKYILKADTEDVKLSV
jgi:hypothetical protein